MSVIDPAAEIRVALLPFESYLAQRPFPVPDRNFMTPDIVGCYEIHHWMIEVSIGDFLGDVVYGLTVYPDDEHTRSRAAHSPDEVVAFLREYVDR